MNILHTRNRKVVMPTTSFRTEIKRFLSLQYIKRVIIEFLRKIGRTKISLFNLIILVNTFSSVICVLCYDCREICVTFQYFLTTNSIKLLEDAEKHFCNFQNVKTK